MANDDLDDIFGDSGRRKSSKTDKRIINNDLFTDGSPLYKELKETCTVIFKDGFSKKTLSKVKNNNLKLRKDLKISDTEYLVLALLISKQSNSSYTIEDFIKVCNGYGDIVLPIYNVIFSLYNKNLVTLKAEFGDISFCASNIIADYMRTGILNKKEPLPLINVIKEMDCIANLYNNSIKLSEIAEKQIVKLLEDNSQYAFCRELLDMYKAISKSRSEFVFYIICDLILCDNYDAKVGKDSSKIKSFCDVKDERIFTVDDIYFYEDHPLIAGKVFEHSIDESGRADKNCIEIHSDFKRKFLKDVIKEKRYDSLIEDKDIIKKELFYNEANSKQIQDLSDILEKNNFNNLMLRLKETGSRSGFTCLFSGSPGTGKTETVYQLAKKTNRNIVKVDMSQLRSKWWGEDEKNVKAIFSNYKSMLKEYEIEPILLLNEADAIIGKRLSVEGNNGAIINSINAVQNIILDELENFEGIIIATTNLNKNFDSAFDRRFLYKIEFEKPSIEAKKSIWKSQISSLCDSEAEQLAKKYDFSGGQIENIARKGTVSYVLNGTVPELSVLDTFCKEEQFGKCETKIGFTRD